MNCNIYTLLIIFQIAYSGKIHPFQNYPILPSIANEKEFADYNFTFKIETDLF